MPTRSTTRRTSRKEPEPLTMLRSDHEHVKDLFRQFESASGAERARLFEEISRELQVHTKLEEEIFYPAVKSVPTEEAKEIVNESVEEHNIVDFVLESMQRLSPDDETFEAKFSTLRENVEHHIQEEEKQLFKIAGRIEDPEALGERMRQRKQQLVAQK
ncbi:MAG TPA: hemerythrin domain-containing protein [Dehalococcoidia bacterium]|nr:hemerythrin domain-containing protein [Dehalococcoidia bacterium]